MSGHDRNDAELARLWGKLTGALGAPAEGCDCPTWAALTAEFARGRIRGEFLDAANARCEALGAPADPRDTPGVQGSMHMGEQPHRPCMGLDGGGRLVAWIRWVATVQFNLEGRDPGPETPVLAWLPVTPAGIEAVIKGRAKAEGGKPLPSPFTPLLEYWRKRPRKLDRIERREDAILPASVIVRSGANERGFMPALHVQDAGPQPVYLPGLGLPERSEAPRPCLPLKLYDLGAGLQGTGGPRAAPIALRTFVEACLAVSQVDRDVDYRGVELPPIRMREADGSGFLRMLYGEAGAKHYRRQKDWPRIHAALELLDSSAARVPILNPDGKTGQLRKIVVPTDVPLTGAVNEWVRFAVYLPPGGERGPLIDRPMLRAAGVQSAVKYRLLLSLAFTWHSARRPVDRRKRIWVQSTRPGDYSPLTQDDLAWMAYPGIEGGASERMRKTRAWKAAQELANLGCIRILDSGVIMPGPLWVGWKEGQLKRIPER